MNSVQTFCAILTILSNAKISNTQMEIDPLTWQKLKGATSFIPIGKGFMGADFINVGISMEFDGLLSLFKQANSTIFEAIQHWENTPRRHGLGQLMEMESAPAEKIPIAVIKHLLRDTQTACNRFEYLQQKGGLNERNALMLGIGSIISTGIGIHALEKAEGALAMAKANARNMEISRKMIMQLQNVTEEFIIFSKRSMAVNSWKDETADVLSHLKDACNDQTQAIMDARNGVVPTNMIDRDLFESVLEKARIEAMDQGKRLMDDSFGSLLDSAISYSLGTEALKITIHLPVIGKDQQPLDFYRHEQAQVASDGKDVIIAPKRDFIAVNKKNKNYLTFNADEMQNCLQKHDIYLCPHSTMMWYGVSDCLSALFFNQMEEVSKRCRIEDDYDKRFPVLDMGNNTFVVKPSTDVEVLCKGGHSVHINRLEWYRIKLNGSCIIRGDNFEVKPNGAIDMERRVTIDLSFNDTSDFKFVQDEKQIKLNNSNSNWQDPEEALENSTSDIIWVIAEIVGIITSVICVLVWCRSIWKWIKNKWFSKKDQQQTPTHEPFRFNSMFFIQNPAEHPHYLRVGPRQNSNRIWAASSGSSSDYEDVQPAGIIRHHGNVNPVQSIPMTPVNNINASRDVIYDTPRQVGGVIRARRLWSRGASNNVGSPQVSTNARLGANFSPSPILPPTIPQRETVVKSKNFRGEEEDVKKKEKIDTKK